MLAKSLARLSSGRRSFSGRRCGRFWPFFCALTRKSNDVGGQRQRQQRHSSIKPKTVLEENR